MTGPQPAGRRWTPAEERQLRELVLSKVKVRLIAKKLKRSPGAIYGSKVRTLLAKACNQEIASYSRIGRAVSLGLLLGLLLYPIPAAAEVYREWGIRSRRYRFPRGRK
jgi:hypothetical protein